MKLVIEFEPGDTPAKAVAAVRSAATALAKAHPYLATVATGLWKAELRDTKAGEVLAFQGFTVRIENPVGSVRKWKDAASGAEGQTTMRRPYGEFVGTQGSDGDPVDCFLGDDPTAPFVYLIDQARSDLPAGHTQRVYDEQKVMLGFSSATEAINAFLAHYDDPRFFGALTQLTVEEFRQKLFEPATEPSRMIKSIEAARVPLSISKGSLYDNIDAERGTGENFRAGAVRTPAATDIGAGVRDLLEDAADRTISDGVQRDPNIYSELLPGEGVPLRDAATWVEGPTLTSAPPDFADLRAYVEKRAQARVEGSKAIPVKLQAYYTAEGTT